MGRNARLLVYLLLFCAAAGGIAWWRISVARKDVLSLPLDPNLLPLRDSAMRQAEEEQVREDALADQHRDASYWMKFPRQKGRKLVAHTDGSYDLSVCADGSRVLTASVDGTACLWDGHKLLQTFAGHEESLYSCALSQDGKRAAAGGKDQYVIVWDAQTGDVIAVLPGHIPSIHAMAFVRDGTLLTADRRGTLRRWDVDHEAEIAELQGHEAHVMALVVNREGTRAYSADKANVLICWDLKTNRVAWRTLAAPTDKKNPTEISHIHLTKDERQLYVQRHWGTIELWDAQSGELLRTLDGPKRAMAMALHPDGEHLVVADANGLFLWTLGSEQTPCKPLKAFGAPYLVHDLGFTPDASMLFVAQGGIFNSAARDGWQEADEGAFYVFDLGGSGGAASGPAAAGAAGASRAALAR